MIDYEAGAQALWEQDRKNRIVDAEFQMLVPHVQDAYRRKCKACVDAALSKRSSSVDCLDTPLTDFAN